MDFQRLLGLELNELGDGFSRARITIEPGHMNPHGFVHGGVLYSMADTGMGAALYSRLKEPESCATIEITMVYIAPVQKGLLECETRLLSKGKRIAFLESAVSNDGKLVAKALGTFAVFSSRPNPPS